jgi:hypothetical protein
MALKVQIDITDWQKDSQKALITSEPDILNQIEAGRSTGQVAKSAVVSREVGKAPKDIMKPNKLLFLSGAMVDIAQKVAGKKHKIQTESGKYGCRDYVGSHKKDDDNDFVRSNTDNGLDRAIMYLKRVVPGYIFSRFLIIHENGGDVLQHAEDLKAVIDDMVERLG